MEPITVVCVRWGAWCSPHGARYVNNLYHGVRQNLSRPHRFVCFTDDEAGLDPEIETRPLPENLKGWWWESVYPRPRRETWRPALALPYLLSKSRDAGRGLDAEKRLTWRPVDLRGFYNKLFLFRAGVLKGRCAFIDLDTVIMGPLDELFDSPADLCMLRDFYNPREYASGLMTFRAEAMAPIWEEFVRRGCPIMKKGDQEFIERMMPGAEFFQDRHPGQAVSYKLNCAGRRVPDYARVVCFHGLPRPHEVSDPEIVQAFDRKAIAGRARSLEVALGV